MLSLDASDPDVSYNLTVYACLAGCNTFATLVRSFAFAYAGVVAARTLHSSLLHSIINASIFTFRNSCIGAAVDERNLPNFCMDLHEKFGKHRAVLALGYCCSKATYSTINSDAID